ncbi:MAG TPA: DnaJ C-terminal domain-containing protein [Aromatoleum sp.]|uniref:DnaJ C-terminal domain-containing protein n=1 Tax=Aromatoleum sp. TaxID=2307007 RepID=UPI002B47185C|nr:DnaJ C-terminal domain-containing protein [Aromatoleum sp.]HJV25512.1 DnaJ C-terminal domain-containing protein [Aromatoleum sp.]
MDPHALLGLQAGATAHEIKKAFRRLAMRWHPDRNPDPHAVEHFKQLRAAYETLIDAVLHPLQDEAPTAAETPSETAEGANDARTDESDGSDERTDVPTGADRYEDLELSFEDACCGGTVEVTVEDVETCEACEGSGRETLRHTRLCTHCHGSGRLRGKRGLTPCTHCSGRGYVTTQACGACGGSGQRHPARRLAVRIPAGALDGDEIRIARAGHPPPDDEPNGIPGDLVVHVHLAEHALYRLEGRNLRMTRPVSALRLLIGGEIAVPLPGGERQVTLQPGTAEARTLRIAGAGFPGRMGRPDGDLFIEFVPVMPRDIDDELRPLLEQLDTLLVRGHSRYLPDVAVWEDRWLGTPPPEA